MRPDVSLSPLIPGSAAGKAQEEYLSLPYEGSRAASRPHPAQERSQQHPAHLNPAETLSQRRKWPGSAWLCSARRGDVPFWHCPPPLGPVLIRSHRDPSTNTWAPLVSYLWDCPRSRDQPSRGPAVALVPPLLNSVSDMSSGLKVVD